MIDYVTVEIGSGGSTVMVEPELRKGLTRRVFRRMLDGSLEWAAYDDWRTHNERARFFGFASRSNRPSNSCGLLSMSDSGSG